MQPADFNRYGFDLVFCMTEVTQQREVARGKTGIVFIDPGTRRVCDPGRRAGRKRSTAPTATGRTIAPRGC
jgi:hypothetical protein